MKFYKPTILITLLLVFITNFYNGFSLYKFIQVFWVFVIILLPTGIILLVSRLLPDWVFDSNKGYFKVSKFEQNFYKFIKVKRWKDNVPELGSIVDFEKNKIAKPKNKAYLQRFLLENCKGDFVHILSVVWTFVALLFVPNGYYIKLAYPLLVVHVFLHILPVFIQRYNRPRLLKIYKLLLAKENKISSSNDEVTTNNALDDTIKNIIK